MADVKVKLDDFVPDQQQLRCFLTFLARDWFHLYSSDPDNTDRRKMRGYVAASIDDAIAWIERQQRQGRNIYYALNTPKPSQTKKAAKDELRELAGPHTDWDLPKDMDRASDKADRLIDEAVVRFTTDKKLPGNPTIIMTGNGVQAIWLLRTQLKATEANQIAIETLNRQLAQHFGAPLGTHNSERILRVPGTWNFPDAVKRSRGCVPVLAELVCLADDDFVMDDFAKLPPMDPVKLRVPARRKDWTDVSYKDWTPWNWPDLLETFPDLPGRLSDTLAGNGDYDRSRACYALIRACIDFVMIKQGCPVEDIMDDPDVAKQIAELCWEGAEAGDPVTEAMGHYEDHEFERAQLGYDIGRCLDKAADENRRPTETAVRRIEARAAVHATNAKAVAGDVGKISIGEAEKAFTEYVRNHVQRKDLPEADMAQEEAAKRQPITIANVRETLRVARITARWDMMRNEPRFFIDPDAGDGKADHERPAAMWDVIFRPCMAHMRSRQELATLYGALVNAVGMVDKRAVHDMLCDLALHDPYHPLEDYCLSRPWDGVDRFRAIADCLDTDHPLKYRYMEMFFFQCVGAIQSLENWKRCGQGLQLGYTLLLVGPQNIGKSTFWERVVPAGFLASGTSLKLGTPKEADGIEQCLSGLVCSLNEIAQTLDKSDSNAFKDFQTRTVDTWRAAYGRHQTLKPRMTVPVATANEDHQLRDQTGTRRWLSMLIRWIDQQRLNALTTPTELQQVFAQAYHMVMLKREPWRLTEAEEMIVARENAGQLETPQDIAELEDYLGDLTKAHKDQWMSATQICKVLGIRYMPSRWPILKSALDDHGLEYRTTVRTADGQRHQKAWRFPVLPERWDEVRMLRPRA